MVKYISFERFRIRTKSRTPFIIYFLKENEEYCQNVLNTLEKLHRSFPFVLCFCTKRKYFPVKLSENELFRYENVYSFRDTKVDKIVAGTSYSELFDLFIYVFNESSNKYLHGYRLSMKHEYGDNFSFYNLPDLRKTFKNLLKHHKYVLYPPVCYKYSHSEIKYLSTLKDCSFKKSNNRYFEILSTSKINMNPMEQKKEEILNPKFPEPIINFRAPSPFYFKDSDSSEQKKIKSTSWIVLKKISRENL